MRQNKVKVAFTIDPATYEHLRKAFDSRQRSAFVNQAIESELKKNALLNFQKMIDKIKPVKSDKTSVELIRELRDGRVKELLARSSPKKSKK